MGKARFYKVGIDQYLSRLSSGLQSPTEINALRGCAIDSDWKMSEDVVLNPTQFLFFIALFLATSVKRYARKEKLAFIVSTISR